MAQHIVTKPNAAFKSESGRLEVHQVPAWEDNLIWLIRYNEQGDCAVVDGPEAGPVLEYCEAHGLTLTTVLNTHTHGDHIGINRDLNKRGLLEGMRVVGGAKVAGSIPGLSEPVKDGDPILLGQVGGEALLTEGHIDGHISYVFEDLLFCGDALFGGGCGYLFDGPPVKMHESLNKLSDLPSHTKVCCAHEYTQDNLTFAWSVESDNASLRERIQRVWALREDGCSSVPSTIGEELATNPFLRHGSSSLREKVRQALPEEPFDNSADIFRATRLLKDKKIYREGLEPPLPI